MTGYSKVVETKEGMEISVEVKTLNSKYLSLSFSIPSYLSPCEVRFSEIASEYFKRGKVTIRVFVRFLEPPTVVVDLAVAQAYHSALEELASRLGIPEPVNLEVLTRMKDVVRFELTDEEIERICRSVEGVMREAMEKALREREIEGEKLKEALRGFLEEISSRVEGIEKKANGMMEYYSKMLRENVEKVVPDDVIVDRNILETAIAVLAERADIREEIDRLKSHVSRALDLLESDGAVGVNLDFLAQEMLREFNTILSKAKIVEIADLALEGKVLVNSFREQVQNVE